MKTSKVLFFASVLFFTSTLTSCSKVPAGHKGIKVYLLGGEKGVDHEELGVGRYWIGINQQLYLYPTFTQNYVWTQDEIEGSENDESISFQTKEGLSVNADFGITYRVDPNEVNTLFETFRRGIDEITDVFLRNMLRDALNKRTSTMTVENVYGIGKAQLLDSVLVDVQQQVLDKGIIVEKIYAIGDFRLPPSVVKSLNLKIEATQKAEQAENELREAEAEAKKKVAKAQGEAEANRIITNSITPQLLQWEKIQNEKLYIEQWNGVEPTTKVGGETGVLLNVR